VGSQCHRVPFRVVLASSFLTLMLVRDSSRLMTVGSSDDTSCLVATTPVVSGVSTTTTLYSTTTTTPFTTRPSSTIYESTTRYITPSPSPTDPVQADRPVVSTAAIAGGAAGGVTVVAILLAIGIFLWLRRRRNRRAVGHYDPAKDTIPDVLMTEDTKQVDGDESKYYAPTPLIYTAQTEPPIQSDKRTTASPRYTVMAD
jgi:hypothetical protein